MRKVSADEILNLVDYERIRPEFRRRIVELKKNRRLAVGNLMTLVFENRDTVLFQIQEMIRVERIVNEEAIQHEVETYNILVPGENELSATLLIEVQELKKIKEVLDSLVGLQNGCLTLQIGEERIVATFDEGQSEEDRISAVQYIRFRLTAEQVSRFTDASESVFLSVDHPRYNHRSDLPRPLRDALIGDLQT